jgi:heme/copper-type cytochrome/quinol oxidase subunit 1
VTQLIFGVAFWMFPRHTSDAPRGSERLGWASYWLLNAGLILRLVGEPARVLGAQTDWMLMVSALLQLGAGCAFVFNIWPRIKER